MVLINDIDMQLAGPRTLTLKDGSILKLNGVEVDGNPATFGFLISQVLTLLTKQENDIIDLKADNAELRKQLEGIASGLRTAGTLAVASEETA
ncbi:hypothetical protein [Erwinia phage Kuerle]|nr:hypothetical protein [Erwinia phage Kuerle]